jgi:hypothetical protein
MFGGDAHTGAYAASSKLEAKNHQASKPSNQPPYPLEIPEQPLIYFELRTGITVRCVFKKDESASSTSNINATIPFLIPHRLQHPNNLILLRQSEFSAG